MKLFLDESGNTGTNWFDQNQPYFVYGGWLFCDDQCQKAIDKIDEIFSFSAAKELKSKYILEKKRNSFFEMMKYLIDDLKAIPMFVIADKKYMIAAKIVETFFDCNYNPYVNGYLTKPTPLKKALADYIFEDESLMSLFAGAMKNCKIDLLVMRDVRDKIVKHFESKGLIEVEATLKNLSDDNLNKMIDEFLVISKNWEKKSSLTLTIPILMQLIDAVDVLGDVYHESIEIFPDKLPGGYEKDFQKIEKICQRKKIIMNVSNINMIDSRNNVLVQAADLFCGYIMRSLNNTDVSSKEEASVDLWNTLIILYDLFFEKYRVQIWNYNAHGSFIEKIGMLVGERPQFIDNSINEIKKSFRLARR